MVWKWKKKASVSSWGRRIHRTCSERLELQPLQGERREIDVTHNYSWHFSEFFSITSRHIKEGKGVKEKKKPSTQSEKVGGREWREEEELIVNYSNGTDPFLEVEAEVRDQGRGNALWVRQQPWSLGSIIPLPTANLGFDLSPTLHAPKKENTKHSEQRKNRCISITRPSFSAGCCFSPFLPLVPRRHRYTALNSNNHFRTVPSANKHFTSYSCYTANATTRER